MSFKFIYNSVWALSQKGKQRLKKEEKSNKINWTLLNHTVLWFCTFILLYMRHVLAFLRTFVADCQFFEQHTMKTPHY